MYSKIQKKALPLERESLAQFENYAPGILSR